MYHRRLMSTIEQKVSISPSGSAEQGPSAVTNLLGLDREGLEQFFLDLGEKKFRATQVMKWIHQLGVTDFQQMNNLSKPLRNQLDDIARVTQLEVAQDHISSDGTRKWLLRLDDGNHIETVWFHLCSR